MTSAIVAPALHLLASIPSPPSNSLNIGSFTLRYYGLMIALGVIASVWVARRRYAGYGGDPEDVTTIALVAVPAGLVGARLYHVITDWPDLYSDGRWWPDAFMVWKGGLGIPGGIFLGTVAGILTCRYLKIDWRVAADAGAPAIPVAQAVGRLGNWFNQEVFGRPTDLPWGLQIDPENRPAEFLTSTTFHPTFLYEGLWNLGLAGLIVWASGRTVLKRGRWLAVYVVGYGLGRLWIESLRSDAANTILGLRVNIWTSLLAILGGLLWLFWKGNPVDHEATERLRSGTSMAEIIGGVGVRGVVAEQIAASQGEQAEEPGSTDAVPDASDVSDRTVDEAPSDTTSDEQPADDELADEAPADEQPVDDGEPAVGEDDEPVS